MPPSRGEDVDNNNGIGNSQALKLYHPCDERESSLHNTTARCTAAPLHRHDAQTAS